MRREWIIFGAISGCLMSVAVIFAANDVSADLSNEEQLFFSNRFSSLSSRDINYESEIKSIIYIQSRVIELYPVGDGIPIGQNREPLDLDFYKSGLCYDRSRMLYKAFKWLGFEARQTFLLYPLDKMGNRVNPIFALLSSESTSHAIVEVLTKRGWVTVDTNTPWISISNDGRPISIKDIYKNRGKLSQIPWSYEREFIPIRGLLSRNGRLYPPFNAIPDVHWGDLIFSNFD